jgi:hypothetical protein
VVLEVLLVASAEVAVDLVDLVVAEDLAEVAHQEAGSI